MPPKKQIEYWKTVKDEEEFLEKYYNSDNKKLIRKFHIYIINKKIFPMNKKI